MFALLYELGVPYLAASIASYAISNALMYVGNRYFTFALGHAGFWAAYLRYALVGIVIVALNAAVLVFLVEVVGAPSHARPGAVAARADADGVPPQQALDVSAQSMSVALEPASRWSYAELAAIFNAGYEGYYTPFSVDEAGFRFMSTTWDDDLDASRVALVDGEPAGICKLAIRGDQGWIAGIGVAAPHRGEGVGETLMRGVLDEARARGLREVWLEVLVQNEPAIRLYEKLGFEHVRELEVWTLEPLVVQHHKVRSATVAAAQRADPRASDASASRGSAPTRRSRTSKASEALESERGAMLFRAHRRARLAAARRRRRRGRGPRAARVAPGARRRPSSWLNGPEGDPFNAAIESLGGTLAHRQHEMVLRL